MDARDPTANNAELWAHYLRKEWATALDPLGLFRSESGYLVGRQLSDAIAATVSAWTAMFLGPMITSLYVNNEPAPAPTLPERTASSEPPEPVDIPEAYAATPAPAPVPVQPASSTQLEDWRESAAQGVPLVH